MFSLTRTHTQLQRRHMPKQTTPAAPIILFNVFITMSVIICHGHGVEAEHKEGEFEAETFTDGKSGRSKLLRCSDYHPQWHFFLCSQQCKLTKPSLAVCLLSLFVSLNCPLFLSLRMFSCVYARVGMSRPCLCELRGCLFTCRFSQNTFLNAVQVLDPPSWLLSMCGLLLVSVCVLNLCLFVCRSGSRVWGQWFTTLRPTTSVQWPASRNSECILLNTLSMSELLWFYVLYRVVSLRWTT